jgi:hypothetical protein
VHTRTGFVATSGWILRQVLLGLAFTVPVSTTYSAPSDSENIVVVASQGDVRVTMLGETRTAKPGTVITPPATIRTGRDGTIELRQGRTRASIAPDTQIEIPTLGVRGKFVERIVQPRGNVFYDIAPRSGRKLRVETPYLVAVIKGTQFNVAAYEETTTVSLFEGRLEIWAADDSDVVQLNAGEIATRGRGDQRIRVLQMATGETLRANNASPIEGATARSSSVFDPVGERVTSGDLVRGVDSPGVRLSPVDSATTSLIDTGSRAMPTELIDTKVDLDSPSIPATADLTVDLGADGLDANVGAAVDLGAASLDANVSAALDLGAGSLDAAVALDSSLAGAVDVGMETTAAVDLGSAAIDAGLSAGVGLGGMTLLDADVSAGVDAAAGTIDLGADAALVDTPVALDAGVDLGSGSVDLGVTVGALDVGLDVDLGLLEPAPAPVSEPTIVDELVQPLRGLLGR